MINHFRTWLINRPVEFFADSLFPVATAEKFRPSPQEEWTSRIDRILFGENPDASLVDYRFFQFLRLIDGSHFREHVCRFDPRETYRPDQYEFFHDSMLESSITPMQGLTVTEHPQARPEFLRKTFTVLYRADRLSVLGNDGRSNTFNLTTISNNGVRIDSLGLSVTASRPGTWRVDYRIRPQRSIEEIVQEIDALPVTVLRSLFEHINETAPEYEEGYRTITDSLSRFCMVLFAQAISNELMQNAWEKGPKRLERDSNDLSADSEGPFYYGSHSNDLLRLIDLKNELRCLTSVRGRCQTVEITVPQTGYLYLAWPIRFGLPARNRIIVDGFLNSAWSISYLADREELYVVFRSEHKIRTETPIQIEVP